MPQIEIKIWTMVEGKVKEIMIPEFSNQIFVVKEEAGDTLKEAAVAAQTIMEEKSPLNKGKVIFQRHNTKLYENIANEVKQLMDAGYRSRPDIARVLKKYYPKYKRISLKALLSIYRCYIEGKYNNLKTPEPIAMVRGHHLKPLDRGLRVGQVKHCAIYQNILNDVKQGIKEGKKQPELMTIIKKYTTKASDSTLRWYVKMYRRFISMETPFVEFGKKKIIQRGPKVGTISNKPIYQNILDECKNERDRGSLDFTNIIKKYHPNISKGSISRYTYDYRRYLGIRIGRGIRVKKVTTFFRPTEQPKKRKRRRKKPSPDHVGYDKKYKIWIKQDWINRVKQGINTFGLNYVPTTKNIVRQSGLSYLKVMATLDYMQRKGLVNKINKNRQYIYRMTS